jgi:muconolactone delta-isomerase
MVARGRTMVGGGAVKKLRRAEGDVKNVGVFRVKNHDFMPKKSYFFQF